MDLKSIVKIIVPTNDISNDPVSCLCYRQYHWSKPNLTWTFCKFPNYVCLLYGKDYNLRFKYLRSTCKEIEILTNKIKLRRVGTIKYLPTIT